MKRSLNHLLIGIAVLSAIIWGALRAWSEEPAEKSPEEIRAERHARCERILRDLFPSEFRTDVNYFGYLADNGILTGYAQEDTDALDRKFHQTMNLYIEGSELNESLFGKNPDTNVNEKRFSDCLDELNRLSNEVRSGVEELYERLPKSALWEKWSKESPVSPPKTQKEMDVADQLIWPSVANRLALLSERGLLTAEQADDAESLGLKFIHAAYLRFKLNREIKQNDKDAAEKDMNTLHTLLDLIEQDEKKLRPIFFNLPTSKRWKEVWEK